MADMNENDISQTICSLSDALNVKVASEMRNEIITCPTGPFLKHYLPFDPVDEDVEECRKVLVKEGLLSVTGAWTSKAFERPPSTLQGSGNTVFARLQQFSMALATVRLSSSGKTHQESKYRYFDQPNSCIEVEGGRSDYKIDGSFCKDILPAGSLASSDIAVVAEFKKQKRTKDLKDNRHKIVGAANAVMNDDPRRLFVYGLTIEDDDAALWYFSRSHSAKSYPFDLVKDPETLIKAFVSFLFASQEDMGYDPSIKRMKPENQDTSSYIYTINDGSKPRYFQTHDLIHELREHCITGCATRVWEAKEVNQDFTSIPGAPIVVLRDVWMDDEVKTEREIQDSIFADLEGFKAKYPSTGPDPPHFRLFSRDMKHEIQHALSNETYKRYFLTIMCDSKGKLSKAPVAEYAVAKDLFLREPTDPAQNPSESLSDARNITSKFAGAAITHKYLPKLPYRLVYKERCSRIDDSSVASLSDSLAALRDCFTALTLLYCAGWVHRDISCGNVLVWKDVGGTIANGKLGDLEYAKKFPSGSTSADPKVGTMYFMPTEILDGAYLCPDTYWNPESPNDVPPPRSDSNSLPNPVPLQHDFQHDLESLWWLTLWILTTCVNHGPNTQLDSDYLFNPSFRSRHRIFTNSFYITSSFHHSLSHWCESLETAREYLYGGYLARNAKGVQMDPTQYSGIFGKMHNFLHAPTPDIAAYWIGKQDVET